VVALRGEIDLAAGSDLHSALELAIARGDGDINVCLHAVTFLDCRSIGILVAARATAARAGRTLFISRPEGIVRLLLETTGDLAYLTGGGTPPTCRPQPTCGQRTYHDQRVDNEESSRCPPWSIVWAYRPAAAYLE
jgi:anti-anti-sigma factor